MNAHETTSTPEPVAPAAATITRNAALTVLVSALGYFVDIYDLILFGVVKKPSLEALGLSGDALAAAGGRLISLQMTGMLVGGLVWGVMGDRLGRKSTLFGSILVYSLANVLNAFVTDVDQYGLLRFIAGLGLAGELGAAVTIVSETLSTKHRGYGTTIVAGVGVSGALLAAWVGQHYDWKIAYIVGGVLGLALLALRFGTFESGLFDAVKKSNVSRGDLRMLLSPPARLARYLGVIATGVPIWFFIGILVLNAPDLASAKGLGIQGAVTGGDAIFWAYLGLGIGDVAAGVLSQLLGSRKRAFFTFLALSALILFAYLTSHGASVAFFKGLLLCVGLANGYWAVFATTAAEQFGTNLRATVAITAPNFVRGTLALIDPIWRALSAQGLGPVRAAAWVGAACLVLAFVATAALRDSFHRDLDYLEE